MGWSFRKSIRILPGIRVNLSKAGPRLSIGVPGARASINARGQARIYGGSGPLRYQKTMTIGAASPSGTRAGGGFMSLLKKLIS
jgi:hypothetical protein